MAWMAAIPAIAGAAASLIGGERSNAAMRKLSNTAHQREVADLRAAGLNPILSATGGHGATTPQQENVLKDSVSTALSAQMAAATLKNMKSQNLLLARQAENVGLQSDGLVQDNITKFSTARYSGDNARLGFERLRLDTAGVEAALQGLEVEGRLNSQTLGQIWERVKTMDMSFGEFVKILQSVLGNASSALELARGLRR